MRTVTWIIPDLHCRHCLQKITEVLGKITGVRLVHGDPEKHRVTVEGSSPEVIAFAKLRLAEAGYPVQSGPGTISPQ